MDLNIDQNAELLKRGSKQLGMELSEKNYSQLLAYLNLIIKWNKAYNLTAIRDPKEMVRLHLLDSLAALPLICAVDSEEPKPERVIDVGTGAGLPGVVLAILKPDIQVALLDTNGKKCRFLNQVKIELQLGNIEVIHHRVETYSPKMAYEVVISRAFATLKDMTDNAGHLLSDGGRFLAMKGRYPEQEIAELDSRFLFEKAYPLQIPGLDVERHLIEISISK